jgi:hypothetical protein
MTIKTLGKCRNDEIPYLFHNGLHCNAQHNIISHFFVKMWNAIKLNVIMQSSFG